MSSLRRSIRVFSALAVLAILTVVTGPSAEAAPVDVSDLADVADLSTLTALTDRAGLLPVIVTLSESADDPAAVAADHVGSDGHVRHVYESALRGYAASLPVAVLEVLLDDGRVRSVELDGQVHISDTQSSPPWGLDRIDQERLPLDGSFTSTSNGAGVDVYIIDTGVRLDHQDLTGRIRPGPDVADGDDDPSDCQGHGTHVAGTAAGTVHGVAKAATIVPVKAFGCSGSTTTSNLVAAIDWVTADHDENGRTAVANMSFGGGASKALDAATQRMIADGVVATIAAGNGNAVGMAQDACTVSPARVPEAVTVGATTRADREASFSNDGPCVDLVAPGVDIVSAGIAAPNATATLSGTSMAAPHAAGVAALYLDGHGHAAPADVHAALNDTVTRVSTESSWLLLFRRTTTLEILRTIW